MKRQTEFLTYHLLKIKQENANNGVIDYIIDNHSDKELEDGGIKNVCAKLHVSLVDDIDKAINFMDISKRQFIETAVISALQEFHELYDQLDVEAPLRATSEAMDQEGK